MSPVRSGTIWSSLWDRIGDRATTAMRLLAREAAEAREDARRGRYARWSAIAVLLLGGLDMLSTHAGLALGVAEEANPVMRAMIEILGPFWALPKMAGHLLIAQMLLWYPCRPAVIAITCTSLLSFLVVANNVLIIAGA